LAAPRSPHQQCRHHVADHLLDGGESLGGLEEEILTNSVAPIDLSVKLLPLLRASSAAAVVMVSSGYTLAPVWPSVKRLRAPSGANTTAAHAPIAQPD
jgi:hypothetical protein